MFSQNYFSFSDSSDILRYYQIEFYIRGRKGWVRGYHRLMLVYLFKSKDMEVNLKSIPCVYVSSTLGGFASYLQRDFTLLFEELLNFLIFMSSVIR